MRFLVWATEGMSGADIEMLVDAGKRFLVLHRPVAQETKDRTGQAETGREAARVPAILDGLRRQAGLNTRMFTGDRAALLTGPLDALSQALQKAGLNQAERGVVLGLSQSAVSRRGKRDKTAESQEDANANGSQNA